MIADFRVVRPDLPGLFRPDGLGIAQGRFGGEAEHRGDVKGVAVGGAGLFQDAVLTEPGGGSRQAVEEAGQPVGADRAAFVGGASGQQQLRVPGVRPAFVPMVQVIGQRGGGEGVQESATGAEFDALVGQIDLVECQASDLMWAEGVDADECDHGL